MPFGTLALVGDVPAAEVLYDVECPHCGKSFNAPLLAGAAERYRGFKCPHCRLFVPFGRTELQHELGPDGPRG